jgi:tellurite resistance protein TehA-like permease
MLIDGRRECSDALFAVNVVAYPLLLLVTVLRIVQFWKDLWADLTNPRLVFSFFTIVAGTDVFGVGANLRGFGTVALVLWLCALVLWLLLIYFSFGVLALSNSAQSADIIHGGWLNAIVGTQSLVILGTVIAPAFGSLSPTVLVLIHMLWGVGLGLYAIFIALFAHRIFFFQVEPDDITPILWVVMGAAAISTDAGSTLIETEAGMPFLDAMRPFVGGVSLLMWAWGTWWIPLLLLLGIWKHGICRLPLIYTPVLWSLVFPLGMYSVASFRLSLAADFAPLQSVAKTVMWVAFGAWIVTGIALGAASWRSFSRATQSREPERK